MTLVNMQIYPEVHVCADLDRIAAITDQRDALQKALADAEAKIAELEGDFIPVASRLARLAAAEARAEQEHQRAERFDAEVTAYEEQLTAREQDWEQEHARAERLAAVVRAHDFYNWPSDTAQTLGIQRAEDALQDGDLGGERVSEQEFISARPLTPEDVEKLRRAWADMVIAEGSAQMPCYRIVNTLPQENGPVKAIWSIPVVEIDDDEGECPPWLTPAEFADAQLRKTNERRAAVGLGPLENQGIHTIFMTPGEWRSYSREEKHHRLDGLLGWTAQFRAWVHAGERRVRALLRKRYL